MDGVLLLRQDATSRLLYCIQMVKYCRHVEHRISCIGPNDNHWSDDLEKAIKHYCLWFHETGHSIYYDTMADCCSFEIEIKKKGSDD